MIYTDENGVRYYDTKINGVETTIRPLKEEPKDKSDKLAKLRGLAVEEAWGQGDSSYQLIIDLIDILIERLDK